MTTMSRQGDAAMRQQEAKDAYIAERVLSSICHNGFLEVHRTADFCHCDLECRYTENGFVRYFNVEVKSRNKSPEYLVRFPYGELKISKYSALMSELPLHTELLYMVLLNESVAYIFNLSKIDISKIKTDIMYSKTRQVEWATDTVGYQIYQFPYSAGVCVDCSQFYADYYKMYREYLNGNQTAG